MTAHVLLDNTAYLSKCQVDTPDNVVQWAWELTEALRGRINNVIDLGAGDGRFSKHGCYQSYLGVEIDATRLPHNSSLGERASMHHGCAFELEDNQFDLCIGNPPYVRHHDIDSEWQRKVAEKIELQTGKRIDLRSNAFVLFMFKALISTKHDGLVSMIVPFEWVSRPATIALREFIQENGWSVNVYQFSDPVFPRVLTTACLTVIDKSTCTGKWSYHTVSSDFHVSKVPNPTGSSKKVAKYVSRTRYNYALRGLSPGGQAVFCLTEGQRLHHGLKVDRDVVPCVTSLRHLPAEERVFSKANFRKYYVEKGHKCWLISSYKDGLSDELEHYLAAVPESVRDNATCNARKTWWKYIPFPAPAILYASGFVSRGPKILSNPYSVIAVGSVQGIHNLKGLTKSQLITALRDHDFESQLVSHAKKLKKIEINQMNGIIQELVAKHCNGK